MYVTMYVHVIHIHVYTFIVLKCVMQVIADIEKAYFTGDQDCAKFELEVHTCYVLVCVLVTWHCEYYCERAKRANLLVCLGYSLGFDLPKAYVHLGQKVNELAHASNYESL